MSGQEGLGPRDSGRVGPVTIRGGRCSSGLFTEDGVDRPPLGRGPRRVGTGGRGHGGNSDLVSVSSPESMESLPGWGRDIWTCGPTLKGVWGRGEWVEGQMGLDPTPSTYGPKRLDPFFNSNPSVRESHLGFPRNL